MSTQSKTVLVPEWLMSVMLKYNGQVPSEGWDIAALWKAMQLVAEEPLPKAETVTEINATGEAKNMALSYLAGMLMRRGVYP